MNIFKDMRKKKGLTQVELAKLLNVQQTTVSKWEVGRATPDYPVLIKLAELFEVSIDYLLGAEKQEKKPDALTAEERRLVEGYREINAAGKKLVMQTVETLRTTAAGSDSGSKQIGG